MSARRTKIEIIHDILTSIQQKGGKIKPTHLLYKSNLSHKKMMEYLGELMAKKMVGETFEGKDKKYIITEEGLKYIFEFKKIKEFTDSFGL
ncbi:MAG: winged helix-turn-helix domain-containing protein [Candidatus Woesearchaeota archaeon]|nr:winged helix-turn-helix domain-containing protein [Candidatus Woesearchaeota archaeon]